MSVAEPAQGEAMAGTGWARQAWKRTTTWASKLTVPSTTGGRPEAGSWLVVSYQAPTSTHDRTPSASSWPTASRARPGPTRSSRLVSSRVTG